MKTFFPLRVLRLFAANPAATMRSLRGNIFLIVPLFLVACTPTVKVEAPDKPIEINMNIKIEHRVKVEIEKDVKQSIAKNKDIF